MDRQCGSCTLCCKLVPVHDAALDLHKPGNTKCRHQSVKGCGVYRRRGFPACCALWSCRWLSDPRTAALHRPDRTHYVLDVIPDAVIARRDDTGAETEIQCVQVYCDPAFPEAWHDPPLLAYADRLGLALLIRPWGICAFPPSLASDGQWHEMTSAIKLDSPSGNLLLDRLKARQGLPLLADAVVADEH